MSSFLKKVIETNERYKNFHLLDEPERFDHTFLFSDKYEAIQVHDTTPVGSNGNIIGFAGVCKVEGDDVVSLDGDSYTKEMVITGYQEFKNKDGKLCLDLMVDEW